MEDSQRDAHRAVLALFVQLPEVLHVSPTWQYSTLSQELAQDVADNPWGEPKMTFNVAPGELSHLWRRSYSQFITAHGEIRTAPASGIDVLRARAWDVSNRFSMLAPRWGPGPLPSFHPQQGLKNKVERLMLRRLRPLQFRLCNPSPQYYDQHDLEHSSESLHLAKTGRVCL